MADESIHTALKKFFGFDSFRKGQEEIILNIIRGNDTLVIMPTGGGKSLCYQLPAIILEGMAIVISPLIALMKDQVDGLNKKGIPAAFINSTQSMEETSIVIENSVRGMYKLLYIAPERLENRRFLESLKSFDISFLAVDEAHCISEWGPDFRPSYLNISYMLNYFPELPIMALTATATPDVQDDIAINLKMRKPERYIKGFDRPNLSYITETIEEKSDRIADICKETKDGSTIIYCGSRKRVEAITQSLIDVKLKVLSYHAGMPDNFRKYAQDKFINGKNKIIVATSAFGMGIDKADVRNVIHCDLTPNLEAYYQEAGRAGRDGLPARCYLLYQPKDRGLQEFFINSTFPPIKNIETVYQYLYDLNSTVIGMKTYDSIFLSDSEIANSLKLPNLVVHAVINLLERNKILKRGSTEGMAGIQITTSRERITEYYDNIDVRKKAVLEALLRGVSPDVFENSVEFDIRHFMKKYDINIEELKKAIRAFEFARILSFRFPGFSSGISLLKERMEFKELPIDFDNYEQRRRKSIRNLNIVQQYAETKACKRDFILRHFNDFEYNIVCGQCSSCINYPAKSSKANPKQEYLDRKIIDAAYELDGAFGKNVFANYLKGIPHDSIKKHGLSKGASFGQCKEYSLDEIKDGIDKAIYMEKLIPSNDSFSTLVLAEELLNNYKGIKKFKFNFYRMDNTTDLYDKLKDLRHDLAMQNKVVDRAIVSDRALKNISEKTPQTYDEMNLIPGLGKVFMNNFAMEFINCISKSSKPPTSQREQFKILSKVNKSAVNDANSGLSLDDIAKKLKTTKSDIAVQLQHAIESGVKFRTEQFFSQEIFIQIRDLILEKPNITLREIREHIITQIDYACLRVALASARAELK